MAKKLDRADLMFALMKQFDAHPDSVPSMEGSGVLMLLDEIRPVVDIGRPSKIPYSDWRGLTANTSGALIAAKSGYRIVLTSVALATAKTGAQDGTEIYISVVVNGATVRIAEVGSVTLTAHEESLVWGGELTCDSAQAVNLVVIGTWTVSIGSALGYYVKA